MDIEHDGGEMQSLIQALGTDIQRENPREIIHQQQHDEMTRRKQKFNTTLLCQQAMLLFHAITRQKKGNPSHSTPSYIFNCAL